MLNNLFDDAIDYSLFRVGDRLERILFVAIYEPTGVPSIVENIALIQKHSAFPITVVNLMEHGLRKGSYSLPEEIDLRSFSAIILHNTVSYNVENLKSLDRISRTKLAEFSGAKIIMKQDEHHQFSRFVEFVRANKIDSIFSLMPESELQKTYHTHLPETRIIPMLTGYLTPRMRSLFSPDRERPIDIGYRGSIMPLSFGRLCYEKRRIGDEVQLRLVESGLQLDISSRWEDRFGGNEWFQFLSDCKAVLGVESGSGLVDLDGTLSEKVAEIEAEMGPDDNTHEYAIAYLEKLASLEDEVKYYTISPRHFEAMAVGALQLLLPGNYSGKMKPGIHYFEVAEDYSNLSEAVAFLRDEEKRLSMVTAAYEDVILNRENWIEFFVESLDCELDFLLKNKDCLVEPLIASDVTAKNVVVFQNHFYGADPRRDSWYGSSIPDDVIVHHFGVQKTDESGKARKGEDQSLIVDVTRIPYRDVEILKFNNLKLHDRPAGKVLRELLQLEKMQSLSDSELCIYLGMPFEETQISKIRWYFKYLLDGASTLIQQGSGLRGAHALVAINLPALLPALVLKDVLGVPVIYEALEYWPEMDPGSCEAIKAFWTQLELRVAPLADHRGTVSPGLAALMSKQYGCEVYSVPNCLPLDQKSIGIRPKKPKKPQENIVFLFQGNFAEYRCLDRLIEIWSQVDPRAHLWLRGPDSAYKDVLKLQAQASGLLNKTVHFPKAVAVSDLVSAAAADADVGIIPYARTGSCYAHCSPNKLSEFLAAGLPILANDTHFVGQVVKEADCGFVVEFSKTKILLEAIEKLCDENVAARFSKNSRKHFVEKFNWQAVSKPFYKSIRNAVSELPADKLRFFSSTAYRTIVAEVDDTVFLSEQWQEYQKEYDYYCFEFQRFLDAFIYKENSNVPLIQSLHYKCTPSDLQKFQMKHSDIIEANIDLSVDSYVASLRRDIRLYSEEYQNMIYPIRTDELCEAKNRIFRSFVERMRKDVGIYQKLWDDYYEKSSAIYVKFEGLLQEIEFRSNNNWKKYGILGMLMYRYFVSSKRFTILKKIKQLYFRL